MPFDSEWPGLLLSAPPDQAGCEERAAHQSESGGFRNHGGYAEIPDAVDLIRGKTSQIRSVHKGLSSRCGERDVAGAGGSIIRQKRHEEVSSRLTGRQRNGDANRFPCGRCTVLA